jgi:peptidyl-prolyl cis-trans isomerase D
LNNIFKNKFNFSENNIQSYYNQNKETFIDIYKTINFAKLDPRILSGGNEFNDLFFQKIDEIDDLIVEGKSLKYISKKYNLESSTSFTIDSQGIDIKSKNKINFPDKLISKIIIIDNEDPILLIENIEEYFIFELSKTEKVQKKINDKFVAKEILANLERQTKRKIISEIVAKINNNNFNKKQFNELSKDENAVIKKITLASKNDDKILKQELVKQIYAFSENRVIVVTDIDLSENFLIYIDKINNESIDRKSEDYNKYFNLSKIKMVSNLYKTYDTYLKNKYEININHKALDAVKNYFK